MPTGTRRIVGGKGNSAARRKVVSPARCSPTST